MNILHTVQNISRASGGVTIAVVDLVKALQKKHCSVKLTTTLSTDSLLDTEIESLLDSEGLSHLRNFDLVHDHGIWLPANHRVARTTRKNDVPRVVSVHGMLEPWSLQNRALKKKIAWHLYQKKDLQTAKVIHCTSAMEMENVQKLGLGVPRALIPLGVHLPGSFREKIDKKNKTIFFLSRIQPKKGLLNLVRAWNTIRAAGWRITVAGPDEENHESEVKNLVAQLGLQHFFDFVGEVYGAQKEQLFREADLFVLPTHSENFGFVIAEALSYGVPVITTKGAPWNELETHNCGWWIDVGVSPLIDALLKAIEMSDEDLEIKGKNGFALIRDNYSWDVCAMKMAALYKWVLNEPAEVNFIEH